MNSLLDSINEAELLTDLTGKHLHANASYYTSIGYEVGQDPNPDWFSNVHPDDAEVLKQKMKDLLELGFQESEYRVRHKDGSWRWRSARTVFRYAAGNSTAFPSVSRGALTRRQRIAERCSHPVESSRGRRPGLLDKPAHRSI
jgi:PAS domain S-box-containing protein